MTLNQNAMNSVARTSLHDDPHPIVIGYMTNLAINTINTAIAKLNQRFITVESVIGIDLLGGINYLIMFNAFTGRFYQGTIIEVNGLILTMDSLLDSEFPPGSIVDIGTRELNVAASAGSPLTYSLRGGTVATEAIPVAFHITRILYQITCTSAPDFGKFGDIDGGLEYGLQLRAVDGITNNLFNVKTNAEIALIAYDYTPYDASNPGIGVYGVGSRLTFSGQSKLGSVITIGPGEDLHVILQDPLDSLLSFRMAAEGHISEKRILV